MQNYPGKFTLLPRIWLYLLSLSPTLSYAAEDYLNTDPWDRALGAVLQIMTGTTATTVGAIALAGTGYLFLRGRIDVMRLLAIIAGLGLIFGAPHLALLLQQHAGQ
jgi:type IV secretory pathway VirB2 component (pilin)